MPARVQSQPIDRLSSADSVLALLAGVGSGKLPPDERMALATVQIEAAEEWLAAFMEHEAVNAARALARDVGDAELRMAPPAIRLAVTAEPARRAGRFALASSSQSQFQ